MNAPARPLLRWLGGKYRLAGWIVSQMPEHRIYVEPFGGAASVLLRKPRAYNEVLNDLDEDLVNLYRVLRDPELARALVRRLRLTPYARQEYQLALRACVDPLERAARMIVRAHMGHGSNSARLDRPAGFRIDGRAGTTNVAREWAEFPRAMGAIIERLRTVTIECRPAAQLIDAYRTPKALIYADPPYLPETRSDKRKGQDSFHAYRHEMTAADHEALLDQLVDHEAMVMISGYPSKLYAARLRGWRCLTKDTRAHRDLPRSECLWINPAAQRTKEAGPLFSDRPPTGPQEEQTATLPEGEQRFQMVDCGDSAGEQGSPAPSVPRSDA